MISASYPTHERGPCRPFCRSSPNSWVRANGISEGSGVCRRSKVAASTTRSVSPSNGLVIASPRMSKSPSSGCSRGRAEPWLRSFRRWTFPVCRNVGEHAAGRAGLDSRRCQVVARRRRPRRQGLDPVAWTVSERRIRFPRWQHTAAGGRVPLVPAPVGAKARDRPGRCGRMAQRAGDAPGRRQTRGLARTRRVPITGVS